MAVAFAANLHAQQPQQVQDISLATGGMLNGRVVSSAGAPLANEVLTVSNAAGDQVQVRTDATGYFGVKGLPSGNFAIQSRYGTQWIRGWSQGTAPRHAKNEFVQVGSAVVTASNSVASQPCNQPCNQPCDNACNNVAGGPLSCLKSTPAKLIVGSATVGLAVWGIVALATSDSAS
ncbi:MAG: carboxypeptidase-like regulatory domain-containing protein [Planctomycetota bacterium]